ncbi:MAG: hypothetical protein F9K40_02005 [Kofleriaceae bacterium]|nr:MAG: hypothetical protein F9K40_02005 [Kofleriaceae bacterium]MBZ0230773.1 hypothetical protein [Kofleriaceae bacterium]
MTTKRALLAAVLTQVAGLTAATAQPEPPPSDEDEAQPGDVAPPAETPVEAEEPPEVTAEEVAAPIIDRGDGVAEVGYDKGFFIKSGDGKYELKLTGRIQPFYSGTFNKGEGAADKHAFEIRRTRLTVDAKVHKSIGWKLQWDFGKGFLTLKDAHFDWKLADEVWVRVGQWKRPFSRQQINSSGRLELTTRAITDSVFGAERDIGIAIRNDYEKSPNLEWIVGVFNGQGVGSKLSGDVEVDPLTGEGEITGGGFTNVPSRFKPAFIGRVGLNEGGIKGYQEVDLEGGPLRWGVGASVWLEADRDKDDRANQKVQLDYVVKVSGFSTTGGVYGMSSQQGPKTFSDQGLSHVGFHLQAGYLATPAVQVAARYALVDVQTDFESASAVDLQELGLGASYFVKGHDAKFQTAVRIVKPEGANLTDSVVLEVGANVGF